MADSIEIQRGWSIYPKLENTPTPEQPTLGDKPVFIEVTEMRDGDGVILRLQQGSDDDFAMSVLLTETEWRELTSLPVRFAAQKIPS